MRKGQGKARDRNGQTRQENPEVKIFLMARQDRFVRQAPAATPPAGDVEKPARPDVKPRPASPDIRQPSGPKLPDEVPEKPEVPSRPPKPEPGISPDKPGTPEIPNPAPSEPHEAMQRFPRTDTE